MRVLDLFCCAGVGAEGYHRAGFEVVGIDKDPQPNYPYEFVQADALDVLRDHDFTDDFDAIHASPPCQSFTAYRRKGHGVGDGYHDLIAWTRRLLVAAGRPYVIENVEGAPIPRQSDIFGAHGVMLCGSSFGLDVRRHRYFESSEPIPPLPCNHASQRPGRFPGATNRADMSRATVEIGVWRIPLETQKRAMGVKHDVTLPELSEGIPPAYTEYIGRQLLERV